MVPYLAATQFSIIRETELMYLTVNCYDDDNEFTSFLNGEVHEIEELLCLP